MEKDPQEMDIEKVYANALKMATEESSDWALYTDDGTVRQEHKRM